MSKMLEKVRLGFVGCGGIAVSHLKALVNNPHAELVAFCDINLERAKTIAAQYGTNRAVFFSTVLGKCSETLM